MQTTSAGTVAMNSTRVGVVDCDVHNHLDSVRDLYPYLSRRWRDHIERFGLRRYVGCNYPRFWYNREEARPPSGRQMGSEVGFVATDHLDRHGVAYGILNPLTSVGSLTNLELDAALATAVNDWQVAEWLDVDRRLRASMVIPIEDPAAAVAEIRRREGDRRFVQVQFPGRPHQPMGRRAYWPIYEACAAQGLHVMSHAFGSAGQPITGTGWPSFYIEDHIGPSQAMQANVVSLAVEGVFEAFPGLKVVSVENAFGWMPSLIWRLDATWALLKDELPHLRRPPSEYIAESVYLATQPIEEPPRPRYFDQLLEQYPPFRDHLMFSSDYPHWDGDGMDALPSSVPLDVQRLIYSENAKTLYRLP